MLHSRFPLHFIAQSVELEHKLSFGPEHQPTIEATLRDFSIFTLQGLSLRYGATTSSFISSTLSVPRGGEEIDSTTRSPDAWVGRVFADLHH